MPLKSESIPVRFICDSQEEFDRMKTKATKLRVILLERKDKNVFCKLAHFDRRDKSKFIKELNHMWNTMSDSEIDEEFNAICCDKLFDVGKDVSEYPVKESSFPDYSILYNPPNESDENKSDCIENGEEETKS